ncbi:hypothetical protein [Marinomonas sp. BSi20584]|uniref:hypothetical protein n=1 Tax=Marinomonas sp. BSi20584 TaxID=1594462 RepID=UPI000C1E4344|nr:hypothetical protein [Marinomonas sp. BSi20584]PJE55633.1 hypothetical protein TY87_09205 [Marinomonas sp. BSi20584]
MSNVHELNRETPSSLMTFANVEIEVLLEVARHWMKMRVCHEVDQDLQTGWFFMGTWNPRFSILKIEKQGARKGKTSFGGWSVMPLRLAEKFEPREMGDDPFSKQELVLLSEMMVAAVTGKLKRFLMDGAATMPEVDGVRHSAKWTGSAVALRLAEKLDLAALEIAQEEERKFNEFNTGAVVKHA